jgi:hypothetical protein
MKRLVPLFLAVGVCSLALADKTVVPHGRHAAPKFVDFGAGGAAGTTVFYANNTAMYGYIWYLLDLPKTIIDDMSMTPGPFAGGPAQMHFNVQGWIELGGAMSFDMYTQYWDDIDTTNVADPVNGTFIGGYFISVTGLAAGAWQTTLDLTGLPGGGIDLPDDNWGTEHLWLEPGSTTSISDQGSPIFDYRGPAGQTIGFTEDLAWSDDITGTPDGAYNPDDAFFAGGPPFYTGIWFQGQGAQGGGCGCPCDTNCDGSVNGADITSFVGCVSNLGCPTPCDACSGDTNGDGSVNGADIGDFITCVSNLGCP